MDIRRKKLKGVTEANDRLWILKKDGIEYPLTDYNWEITGFDPDLHAIHPKEVCYSGNAYYVTGAFAQRNGYVVEEIEDRR